jgi:hypothetical protein
MGRIVKTMMTIGLCVLLIWGTDHVWREASTNVGLPWFSLWTPLIPW